MRPRHALVPVLALPLAAMALLAAGCGSASPSRGVADVGSSGAATTQSGSAGGPSSASSGSSSGAGGGPGFAMKVADGARFAACMRSHGVPRFPDPSAQGAISIGPGAGINPDSPKFKAAQKACEKLLPNGGQPTPQEQAKLQAQALAFSACMRKHGIPNFPDPQFSGGHVQLSIKGGPGSGLDPKSPKFQAAQKACQGNLPGARTGGVSAGR
jgi:hypothetical protein